MGAVITAIHYCLPSVRLTQNDLEQRFDAKLLKSIAKMSGITERRVTVPGQTASDLAFVATQRLLAERSIRPEEIDLLVFVSQTADYQIPATACVLHGRLGFSEHCAAFDINLGCSAYPYALGVVNGLIATGAARKALLVNADALTQVIHPRDRGLVPLHGDGATVTLLEPGSADRGLEGVFLGTDGSGAKHLMIPASGARQPRTEESKRETADESGSVRTEEHLYMNGPAIFHFSIYKVPDVIRQALARFNVAIEDIDLFIFHQANKLMLDMIYKGMKIPEEKRFFFMEQVGNMSGASTPMVLAEAIRQGRIKPGSRTLLASFGVGLSWGVALVRWPETGIAPLAASVEWDA